MNNNFFLQWLFLKSNKNIPFNNIEICNLLFNDINRWINNVNDISYIIPENDVLIHFYRFIYYLDNNIQQKVAATLSRNLYEFDHVEKAEEPKALDSFLAYFDIVELSQGR